jgi:hypothetical protein
MRCGQWMEVDSQNEWLMRFFGARDGGLGCNVVILDWCDEYVVKFTKLEEKN